jgi:predicted ATPase/class 3 adenylate cyclase
MTVTAKSSITAGRGFTRTMHPPPICIVSNGSREAAFVAQAARVSQTAAKSRPSCSREPSRHYLAGGAVRELPTGTVTFLFTDIETSTRLGRELGTERWHELLSQHGPIIRDAARRHHGVEVRTEGDAFFLAFRTAHEAVAFAAEAQRALIGHAWPEDGRIRVRMGMHTGEAVPGRQDTAMDYVGYDVTRAARVAAAGHGGQVLLSSVTRALLGGALPDGVRLRDLGEHRLKDISEPEHVYQLVIERLPDAFPPLRTMGAPLSNFPLQMTSFVGRERELIQVEELLKKTRLLTLVGTGGTGKSRLAVEAGSRAAATFDDGAVFIPLVSLRDPGLVLSTIARTLSVPEVSSRSIFESLVAELQDAHRLVVLDNFEQVIDAAPAVADLVAACGHLSVLVTSRFALRVSGERELLIEPLSAPDPATLPSPEQLAGFDSVALFMDRARAVRPDLNITPANAAAIASICARLDGLPLAIELAAARIRAISPQELAARLEQRLGQLSSGARDAPARHRTLRDTLAWSYDLLEPEEQVVFRRLAVFAGGCSTSAVEDVCAGASIGLVDILDSLVAKSLLRRSELDGSTRFAMYQTVREFADEQLQASDEAKRIHAAHADHFLRFALVTERQLETADAVGAIRALEQERENIRAALAWYIEQNDFERASRVASAISLFWWIRGYVSEGRSWIDRILALPGSSERTAGRVRALRTGGMIAFPQTDVTTGRRWLEEAVALGRELHETGLVADALHWLGDLTVIDRGPAEGLHLFREAHDLARASGQVFTFDATRIHIAMNAHYAGDLAGARAMADEVLTDARASGRLWATAQAHLNLGWVANDEGDRRRAAEHLREAIALLGALGDRFSLLFALLIFAMTTADRGGAERAIRIAASAEAHAARSGINLQNSLLELIRGPLDAARASLSAEVVEAAATAGREMPIEEATAYALETSVDV